MFDSNEMKRYARQIAVSEFGINGQVSLKKAKVLIVGAGGIGSPVLLYLASSGIGTIGVIDFDEVSLSNLQRQVIFTVHDIGKSKVTVVNEKIKSLNDHIHVNAYNEKLSILNADSIFREYDIIIDGSDNFETKLLVNKCALKLKKIFIIASAVGFCGNIAVFTNTSCCYECIFGNIHINNTCNRTGVIASSVGVIGTIVSGLCINIISGFVRRDRNTLYTWDGLLLNLKEFRLNRDAKCEVCFLTNSVDDNQELGAGIYAYSLSDYINLGYKIIDIRGYAERDIIIPSSEHILAENISLSPAAKVILCCASGSKSAFFVKTMRADGFTNVLYLIGGVNAWRDRYMEV